MESTFKFFNSTNTLQNAADTAQAVAGRDASRTDVVGKLFCPSIIAAMVSTHLLGKPTPWLKAHEFWHILHKDQVN
jgi:hypothetical protein